MSGCWFVYLFTVVLGIKSRALCVLSEHSATHQSLPTLTFILYINLFTYLYDTGWYSTTRPNFHPFETLRGEYFTHSRTFLSQRIFFIPLQRRRRGNQEKPWCRALVPAWGCEMPRMLLNATVVGHEHTVASCVVGSIVLSVYKWESKAGWGALSWQDSSTSTRVKRTGNPPISSFWIKNILFWNSVSLSCPGWPWMLFNRIHIFLS